MNFNQLITPNSGQSSKRFVAIISAIVMFIIAFVDLFTDLVVSEFVFDGLMWLAIGGMGAATLEGFSNNKKVKNTIQTTTTVKTDEPLMPEDQIN